MYHQVYAPKFCTLLGSEAGNEMSLLDVMIAISKNLNRSVSNMHFSQLVYYEIMEIWN